MNNTNRLYSSSIVAMPIFFTNYLNVFLRNFHNINIFLFYFILIFHFLNPFYIQPQFSPFPPPIFHLSESPPSKKITFHPLILKGKVSNGELTKFGSLNEAGPSPSPMYQDSPNIINQILLIMAICIRMHEKVIYLNSATVGEYCSIPSKH